MGLKQDGLWALQSGAAFGKGNSGIGKLEFGRDTLTYVQIFSEGVDPGS